MSPARTRRRRTRTRGAVRGLWLVGAGIVASCAFAALCGLPAGAPPKPADERPVAAGPRAPAQPAPTPRKAPSATPAPVAAAPAKAKAASSLDALESATLDGVNRQRRASGLRPLRSDPRLAEIARAHSRAMAAGKRGFGHAAFDDRSQAVEARVVRYRRVAENVSRHYGRLRADVPAAAVSGWMRSYGHRRNIQGDFSLTGVGAAVSSRGEIFLTQIFVKPR